MPYVKATNHLRKEPIRPLSDRQRKVIDEYFLNGFDKHAAMLHAGYSEQSAIKMQKCVFDHPAVVAELERIRAFNAAKFEINEDWVVRQFVKLALAGETLAKFKKVDEYGRLYWDFTNATEEELALINELTVEEYTEGRGEYNRKVKKYKINHGDPKSALDSIARHLGMFKDKLDIGGELSLVERLQKGRERVKK